MDYDTVTMLLNSVNSILEASDGPVEGLIQVGKHTVSRSQMAKFKEGIESKLETFDESGD